MKFWDKLNNFLDKHFETVEPVAPPVRKFYKVTVFTGNAGEQEEKYYSTAIEQAVAKFARETFEEFVRQVAVERYWVDAEENEEEIDFLKRFRRQCGYNIEEVPKEEYMSQVIAIWRME